MILAYIVLTVVFIFGLIGAVIYGKNILEKKKQKWKSKDVRISNLKIDKIERSKFLHILYIIPTPVPKFTVNISFNFQYIEDQNNEDYSFNSSFTNYKSENPKILEKLNNNDELEIYRDPIDPSNILLSKPSIALDVMMFIYSFIFLIIGMVAIVLDY